MQLRSSELPLLLEEVFVSNVLAYLDETAFLAKIPDPKKQRIIALLKLPSETNLTGLYANFIFASAFQKLEETELFAGVFLEDIPLLNDVYQTVFTLKVSQAQNKNHLSPQSRVGFVRLAKPSVKNLTYRVYGLNFGVLSGVYMYEDV